MNRISFGPMWWTAYYTQQIELICERQQYRRELGIWTEEDLQKSNKELYKNIAYRQNMLNIIENEQNED